LSLNGGIKAPLKPQRRYTSKLVQAESFISNSYSESNCYCKPNIIMIPPVDIKVAASSINYDSY
jgi:hypothetical protein